MLAGAFANSAKEMGSIDATVNLTLSVLPGNLLLPGLFLAACFISISIGTSVGTIVALTPIAAGVATSTGGSLPFVVAVVAGGSFFGDNLSFISDTTVVATRTQECKMADKFKVNFFITAPAAVLILLVYVFMGEDLHTTGQAASVSIYKIIPYMAVLLCAVFGMNVDGTYDVFGWFSSMGTGITGMGELIIITMMAGGMLEIIRENGGIDYLIRIVTRHVNGKKGAELTIAFLVSLVDICTANNTVAILTVGGIARQIGNRYGVDRRKAASILDTFSCCVQGLIPYGAQLLMAAGLAKINPVSIIPHLYYPMALGITALLSILFQYPRRYS